MSLFDRTQVQGRPEVPADPANVHGRHYPKPAQPSAARDLLEKYKAEAALLSPEELTARIEQIKANNAERKRQTAAASRQRRKEREAALRAALRARGEDV
jgi:hypothetical protein